MRRRLGSGAWAALVAITALVVSVALPATSGADDTFHNGDATASADTFALGISAARANLGFVYGRSIASYQDTSARGDARALDLGALPTLFGQQQCDGSPPLLNPAALPPKTIADSNSAGSTRSQRVAAHLPGMNLDPPGDLAGYQDATATRTPSSRAVTESVPADMFLLAVEGGRTESTSQLKDRVRSARAVSTADRVRIFGGLITLEDVRWEAVASSGAQSTSAASFTFERAWMFGLPRSADAILEDLAGFKQVIEQILYPFGVVFEPPKVVEEEDGVKITPLSFRVVNPPFGRDVLMPFLGSIDPLVQSLREQAVRDDCKNEMTLTVVDALLGVMSGSGAVEITVGGAEAVTHDTDYSVPPIPTVTYVEDTVPVDTVPEPVVEGLVTDIPFDDSAFSDLGDSGLDGALDSGLDTAVEDTAPVEEPLPAEEPAEEGGAVEELALPSVAMSSFEDGTAGQAAVAVGVLGLLAAVALSVGDRVLGRRTRRRIP